MRTMIAVGTAAFIGSACSVSTVSEVPTGRDFEIAVGESAQIQGTTLTLTFEDVPEDSRCARDVTCVWAGNARVHLSVQGSSPSSVDLNTTLDPKSASIGNVELRLVSLSPTPVSTGQTPRSAYRATLQARVNE
jgi:hypothetical protein